MHLIESKASIMMGKPVIAGTRITVECILELPGSFTVVSLGMVRIR